MSTIISAWAYVRHRISGEVFSVAMRADGYILAISEALHHKDVESHEPDDFLLDPSDAEWANAQEWQNPI